MYRPTVQRRVTVDGVEYEIDMNWHPDEPSAGLREGWEECSVTHYIRRDYPQLYVCVGFVPDYGKDVSAWDTEGACVITDAWGTHPLESLGKPPAWSFLDESDLTVRTRVNADKEPVLLGYLSGFYQAVLMVWADLIANEAEANRELEEQLAEAGLAAYEARMEEGY